MRQIKTRTAVKRLCYSATGRYLLGSDGFYTVHVWAVPGLEVVEKITEDDPRSQSLHCMFRPGGQLFLSKQGYLTDGEDLPVGEARPEHRRIIPETRYSFHSHWRGFGPDGETFVGRKGGPRSHPEPAGEWGIWRFQGGSGERLACMNEVHHADLWHLAGNGRALVAITDFAKGIAFVDLHAPPPALLAVDHTTEIERLVCSPIAPLAATGAVRTVRLWDALTGECVRQFSAFKRQVEALTFSPDGKLLAAGSREGRVRVWEVESGRQLADLEWGLGRVYALAIAPDNNMAAVACGKGVVLWDLET